MAEQKFKVIIRTISQAPQPEIGAFSEAAVSEYVNEWLQDGWKLFAVNYIGQAPEGYIFAWTLVR